MAAGVLPAGGLFKDLLWCDSDWARVKLSVYVNGPEDVPAAKQMLQSFQLVGLKEFLEPQAGVTVRGQTGRSMTAPCYHPPTGHSGSSARHQWKAECWLAS